MGSKRSKIKIKREVKIKRRKINKNITFYNSLTQKDITF